MNMIVVDDRWSGQNGIGRYAKELLPRITVPLTPIDPGGSPSSPIDFLVKRVSVDGVAPRAIYSPGYNGFLRATPQTITLHDLIHLQNPGSAKYRPYYDLFLKPLLKKNKHVLTNSETSKARIERWLDDSGVAVINAGVGSSPDFTLDGPSHQEERPYFLYVGNLRSHKNVETIVQGMTLTEGADLFIVSSDVTAVAELAARFNVSDRVKSVASVSDSTLAEYYRGARATLQPSLLEGFGLPALESALCGTPVIFYEGCESVREICAGGGISIADALDARAWADAMDAVGDDEAFPSGLIVADSYSWDRVASIVSATLERHQ